MNIKLTENDIINLLLRFEYLQKSVFDQIKFSILNLTEFKYKFKLKFYSKPFISYNVLSYNKCLNNRSIILKFSDTKLTYLKIMDIQTNKILLEIK